MRAFASAAAIAAAISVGCGAASEAAPSTAAARADAETVVVTAATISVEGNVVASAPREAMSPGRVDVLESALRARRGSRSVCEPALVIRIDPDVPWHFAQSAILTASVARCTTLRIRTGQREVTIRVPDPNLEALPRTDALRVEVELAAWGSEVRVVPADPPGPRPLDATTPPTSSKRVARGDAPALRMALVETCSTGPLSACFKTVRLRAEPTTGFEDVAKALFESAAVWRQAQAAEARTPPLVELRSTHMSPETIQRVVRGQFEVFRRCYEEGLRTNPTLTGRIDIRFQIHLDGAVREVSTVSTPTPRDAASAGPSAEPAVPEMSDAQVVRCVAKGFEALRFPKPWGVIKVVYPIAFSPAEPNEGSKN